MGKAVRRVLANPIIFAVIAFVGTCYIRFAFRTTRWRFMAGNLAKARVGNGPVIFCVWHGRQFMMPKLWPTGAPLWVLGSTSFEGQLALAVARWFGIRTIDRQKSALSPLAVRTILRVLRSGESVGLTPDGSRGPRMNVMPGVIELARMSGAPLVPAAYSCSTSIAFSSWDRFLAPLPFGRGIFVVGEPIRVARTANPVEMECARRSLEDALNSITRMADVEVGRAPIAPAEREMVAEPVTANSGDVVVH